MVEISVFLFGALCASVPLIIWHLHKIFVHYRTECYEIKDSLSETLSEMNKLHNNAINMYKDINNKVTKLETELNAVKYNKTDVRVKL